MDLLIVWISMLFTTVADTRGHDRLVDPVPVYPLNMALDSVDDDYKGCSAEISELVDSTYLPLEKFGDFEVAWRTAEKEIQELEPELDHLTMNHAIAIRVYSYKEPNIYEPFNNAVRTSKKDYTTTFMHHSLHFLLTDAIKVLNPKRACLNVYRGTEQEFEKPNSSIRFGSFTSTSLNPQMTKRFGTTTCFEVCTCYGANVSKYSEYINEEEVLIPPYEKFTIKKVIKKGNDQTVMKCETVYQLESSGIESNLRCAMSSSTAGQEIFEL